MNALSEFWDGLVLSEKIGLSLIVFCAALILGPLWRDILSDLRGGEGRGGS